MIFNMIRIAKDKNELREYMCFMVRGLLILLVLSFYLHVSMLSIICAWHVYTYNIASNCFIFFIK